MVACAFTKVPKILFRSPSPYLSPCCHFLFFHNAFFCGVNINTVKCIWEGNIFTIIVNLWETAQKERKKSIRIYIRSSNISSYSWQVHLIFLRKRELLFHDGFWTWALLDFSKTRKPKFLYKKLVECRIPRSHS